MPPVSLATVVSVDVFLSLVSFAVRHGSWSFSTSVTTLTTVGISALVRGEGVAASALPLPSTDISNPFLSRLTHGSRYRGVKNLALSNFALMADTQRLLLAHKVTKLLPMCMLIPCTPE